MRGFHDEMGGPESVAGPEWGRGVGMTAAGLPASPGLVIPSDMPTLEELQASNRAAAQRIEFRETKVVWTPDEGFVKDSPSEDTLRHNFLLRRHLNDPGYGVVPGDGWRERCLTALGVPYVYPKMTLAEARAVRRDDDPRRVFGWASPSE